MHTPAARIDIYTRPTFAGLIIDILHVHKDMFGQCLLLRQALKDDDQLLLTHRAQALRAEAPAHSIHTAIHWNMVP